MYPKTTAKDPDRFRMTFNIPDKVADNLFQYRTKFVQHMLESSMYANSAVGKPWEIIGRLVIFEQYVSQRKHALDDLLRICCRSVVVNWLPLLPSLI